MQPTQHDSVIDPAPATNPRERYCSGAIPGEAGWGICQNLDPGIRPQLQQPSDCHLQHGNVAHIFVFGISIVQAGSDNDTHLVSNSGPQNPLIGL
jgi:hypothetical protein